MFSDPSDEVELVTPVRTPSGDADYDLDYDGGVGGGASGGFPIVIIRASNGGVGGGFGGGNRGRFPFFSFPSFFNSRFPFGPAVADDDDGDYPVGLHPIFGAPRADEEEGDGQVVVAVDDGEDDYPDVASSDCGLICLMFRQIETQLREVHEQIDDVRRRQQEKENEVDVAEGDDQDDGLDVNNSTYTEKVRGY